MKNRRRWSARHPHPMRRTRAALVSVALLALLVAACGSGDGGAHPHLVHQPGQRRPGDVWPRSAPTRRTAPTRSTSRPCPTTPSQQREQLVRRLAAKDSSIDLMSLDPPFVAEFANAGFLRAFDKADEAAADRRASSTPR